MSEDFWRDMEHTIYVALVEPLERHLKLEPGPAIKLAYEITVEAMKAIREDMNDWWEN